MKKQAYIQPVTEIVITLSENLMEVISINNGNKTNYDREETIWSGPDVDDGDFAKDSWGSDWGNMWDE